MSIFQCDQCGCAENTALGWYHCRYSKRLTKPEAIGVALCSACGPTEYPSGTKIKDSGKWHGNFERHYLPRGMFFTNDKGELEHKVSGICGNEAYKIYGSSNEYPKDPEQDKQDKET